MAELLDTIHPWLGYVVIVLLLLAARSAFGRARDAREFQSGTFSFPLVLLDVHVLLGLILYVLQSGWDARPEVAYLHPVLALVALVVGHRSLRRARDEQQAAAAHRIAGRGLIATALIAAIAVAVVAVPAFL